jgi:hypothetical protein
MTDNNLDEIKKVDGYKVYLDAPFKLNEPMILDESQLRTLRNYFQTIIIKINKLLSEGVET